MEEELFCKQVQIERKQFQFALRQNRRGRFIRITEDVGGRRDAIIIPSTGLEVVRDLILEALEVDAQAGPCGEDTVDP